MLDIVSSHICVDTPSSQAPHGKGGASLRGRGGRSAHDRIQHMATTLEGELGDNRELMSNPKTFAIPEEEINPEVAMFDT